MSSERLLLVEDDAATREVLALLLEMDGWQVDGVESGEAALDRLRHAELPFAAVLCDLHLPGVQGAALAVALRPLAPGAILLGMSASEAGSAEREAYDRLLRKPLDAQAVRAALESVQSGTVSSDPAEPAPDAASAIDEREVIEPNAFEPEAKSSQARDLPVIAPGVFLKLEQQMGVRAKELYAFALADAGDRLRRMRESSARHDDAAFRAEAHALKGSAGMIGAERLAALASGAESLLAGSSDGSRDETVHQMHLACDEIRLMLETLFPM